ncbi:hypothetical protein [Halonatronum saccharophilum]|uniref:hypothetical protein n=1 Tax=Halonatronum saccharophilum TaxID=150060 RepID=UPI0004857768|nr:hypothetical protein [Halonatronum saccharophilum]
MIIIIINDIKVKTDKNEVKKQLGYKENTKTTPEIEESISTLIEKANTLIKARSSYKILDKIDLDEKNSLVNLGDGKLKFKSKDILNLLQNQEQVALLTLTIGKGIEEESLKLFNEGQLSDATILDAIGSIATQEVANYLTEIIKEQGIEMGLPYLTMRYSPGYGDLTLDIQPKLLSILDGEKLGIRTNSSHLLIPQKSITAIIGLSDKKDDKVGGCDFNCKECDYNICIYRREN